MGRVHGDRDGYDDPATVSDIGSIDQEKAYTTDLYSLAGRHPVDTPNILKLIFSVSVTLEPSETCKE